MTVVEGATHRMKDVTASQTAKLQRLMKNSAVRYHWKLTNCNKNLFAEEMELIIILNPSGGLKLAWLSEHTLIF